MKSALLASLILAGSAQAQAVNYTQSVQPGDTVTVTAAQDPRNPQPATYNEITVRPNGQVKVISAPVAPPAPPVSIPPAATLLPWVANGNSRTIVWNCNTAGDTRTFYFSVPSNAPNAHSISGTAYSSSANRMFHYTLKELPSGAAIVHAQSTAVMLNFSFASKFGYTVIRKGYTYTLEVVSDATAPYPCYYYLDLNNGG